MPLNEEISVLSFMHSWGFFMFFCVYVPQAEQGCHGYSLCGASVKL